MTGFDEELGRWYEGEVAGAAFFHELASAAQDEAEVEKWRLLGRLESTMAERLNASCAAASIALPATPPASGYLDYARKMAGEPWRSNMEALVPQLREAVARIRTAASQAPADFRDVAADYIAHEEALLAFATAELEAEDGAAAVQSLLDDWSQRPVGPSQADGRGEGR